MEELKHIDFPIPEEKRPQKYQMFRYLARKPPNIVAEYISYYSKKGEVILDPFVGSGVTAIEALRQGRKAIAIDLDPIAAFITYMTLKPVDLKKFSEAFEQIKSNVKKKIDVLYQTKCTCGKKAIMKAAIWQSKKENVKDEKLLEIWYKCPHCGKHGEKKENEQLREDVEKIKAINGMEIKYWYPKTRLHYPSSRPFIKKEKWDYVYELFTKRNLIALSTILNEINNGLQNFDSDLVNLLRFTFASALLQASKFPFVIEKRGKMTGVIKETKEVGSWARPSYWVPPKHFEINAWSCFENRFKKVLRGKMESSKDIERFEEAMNFSELEKDKNVMICNKNALDLTDIIPERNSVDYVFTDPPYGGAIQYLELSTFWASWLKFEQNYDEEITINVKGQGKNFEYYHDMLRAVFERVYEVLKPGRYLTLTFHNTQIKVWNSIMRAVILAGFEHEKTIYQSPLRASAKALRQPYGSVVGDFYIRFKKPAKKGEIFESDILRERERYERTVVSATMRVLAHRGEPTSPGIIITGVMNDLLAEHFYKFGDKDIADVLKKHEGKEFVIVEEKDEKGAVRSRKWWLRDPSSVPYLEQIPLNERVLKTVMEILHTRGKVSFTEVMRKIFMDFPNALIPETQTVRGVLNEYAKPVAGGKWILKPSVNQLLGYHGRIMSMLVDLGEKAGFTVYWAHPLAGKLEKPFRLPPTLVVSVENLNRIRKIDVLWYNDREIAYAFEVENTPIITEAIIRGSNIPSTETKRIMVIPKEYEDKFHKKIHEPALEEKVKQHGWKFIRYDDLEIYYNSNKNKKKIDISDFNELPREPKLANEKQNTLSEYFSEAG